MPINPKIAAKIADARKLVVDDLHARFPDLKEFPLEEIVRSHEIVLAKKIADLEDRLAAAGAMDKHLEQLQRGVTQREFMEYRALLATAMGSMASGSMYASDWTVLLGDAVDIIELATDKARKKFKLEEVPS